MSGDAFRGVVDLLDGTALVYEDHDGLHFQETPIPQESQEDYKRYREAMVEKIVETDEGLMIRYLEGEVIDPDESSARPLGGRLLPVEYNQCFAAVPCWATASIP